MHERRTEERQTRSVLKGLSGPESSVVAQSSVFTGSLGAFSSAADMNRGSNERRDLNFGVWSGCDAVLCRMP